MSAIAMLFRESPGILKITWSILLVGLLFACSGYLSRTPWESVLGFSLMGLGYLASFADLYFRKENREEAAPYYTGVVLSPLFCSVFLVITLVIGGFFLLFFSLKNGYSHDQALRLLHFISILYAFSVILGIPSIARSTKERTEARFDLGSEPQDDEPSPPSSPSTER